MDELGCSNDPITYQNRKMDVTQLGYELEHVTDIAGIKITYYDGFKNTWVAGTLSSMLKERKRPTPKKRKPKLAANHVITAIDCGLEGDNRHSESASSIWEALRRHIPKEKRLQAAKDLGGALDVNWQENLQFVQGFGWND